MLKTQNFRIIGILSFLPLIMLQQYYAYRYAKKLENNYKGSRDTGQKVYFGTKIAPLNPILGKWEFSIKKPL